MAFRYGLMAMMLVLGAACGPDKDSETGTGSTDDPTATTEPATAGSHSATSVGSPTSDPSLTEDAPTASTFGSATTDAVTTDATTSGTTLVTTDASTTDPNEPSGGLYGPCHASEPRCTDGLTCVLFEALVEGIPGDVCAPACSAQVPCPASGAQAQAMCVLALDMAPDPTHCAVICDLAARDPGCPSGTSCKLVPGQPGIGVCTAP
ncbi:hypothetical protein [Nannocystis pusilla]|uniref:hypothetical protein n=1 Tax=Nannocystis pusilla TaxID=889268 RepID=UPI003DA22EE8